MTDISRSIETEKVRRDASTSGGLETHAHTPFITKHITILLLRVIILPHLINRLDRIDLAPSQHSPPPPRQDNSRYPGSHT